MFDLLRKITNAAATIVTAPISLIDPTVGKQTKKAVRKIVETPIDLAEEAKKAILDEGEDEDE